MQTTSKGQSAKNRTSTAREMQNLFDATTSHSFGQHETSGQEAGTPGLYCEHEACPAQASTLHCSHVRPCIGVTHIQLFDWDATRPIRAVMTVTAT